MVRPVLSLLHTLPPSPRAAFARAREGPLPGPLARVCPTRVCPTVNPAAQQRPPTACTAADDKVQPGQCRAAVGKLADYLKEQGI